ncbi:hypothetical protein GCM10008905_19100 [Clostridium malenominatum]|uniref:Uncharacterized protein n=1 Tax=Clostridium malenominatum TaxID=1539 RepID=A0ABN1IZP1_9CLOT
MINLYRDIWWEASTEFKLHRKANTYIEKILIETKFNTFIDDIINHIESFPLEIEKREEWKRKGNEYIERAILKEDTFKIGIIDYQMKKKFFKATKDFIKECREFDNDIDYEDIGQAMRNVWIIAIFQKIIGADIKFTKAIFGYSMLYPYTDNYLDDPSVSMEHKKDFNIRLSRRLKGEPIIGVNSHEEKVYKLIECIEAIFKREEYKKVYEKLLLIHAGQIKSLSQQETVSIPYEKDILGISIEKGGASVLVDGYLINGMLTKDEEIFAYGYGFLLQLCDDLQDVKDDLKNSHMTLMSQLAGKYYLDVITNKLINLTIKVVEDAKCFRGDNTQELKNLIKNNCIIMILFAIVNNRDFYSKEYIDLVEKSLPFTLEYIDTIKSKLKNKIDILKPKYCNVALEDIILYLIDMEV